MKKCPKCGKLNNNQAKFCRYCGTKLPQSTVQKQTKPAQTDNFKVCPKCGTRNAKQSKFCKKCGYKFGTKVNQTRVHTQAQPQTRIRTQHRQVAQTANKAMNNINFGAYFKWLGNTLVNPMKPIKANHYFGMISLIAMAVLLWIANVLSTGSEITGNELSGLTVKYLPLKMVASNEGNAQTPIGYVILSIGFILIPVVLSYACKYLLLGQHQNVCEFCNQFSRLINITLIWTILLIFSIVISQATLVELFQMLISVTMILGIFASLKNNVTKETANSFYLTIGVLLVNYIGLALIATVLGLILG